MLTLNLDLVALAHVPQLQASRQLNLMLRQHQFRLTPQRLPTKRQPYKLKATSSQRLLVALTAKEEFLRHSQRLLLLTSLLQFTNQRRSTSRPLSTKRPLFTSQPPFIRQLRFTTTALPLFTKQLHAADVVVSK